MDKNNKIKKDVIDRVKDSKDHAEIGLYQLSQEQEESIEIGRSDLRNGKSHSNELVISEMKEKFNNYLYF